MDHYKTLNIPPNASPEEIKKAFRKLALQYHPDRNRSPDASLRFRQVQEAWQVLKDKRTREAYNYRRYSQQPQQASRPLAQNMDDLLKETVALQKKTNSLDPFRVDYDLLLFAVKDVLSEHNRRIFRSGAHAEMQSRVFRNILDTMRLLPFPTIKGLVPALTELAASDTQMLRELNNWLWQTRWQYYWDRYNIWFALALALLFCLWLLVTGR